MQENIELIQKGFRSLLTAMSGFIGQEMSRKYKNDWWDEVREALSDQYDLPYSGGYSELIDSLDIANCLRLIDRRWNEVFRDILSLNCRTWAKELMGVRNVVAHAGSQDTDDRYSERALDTMALLCKEIDDEAEKEIRELYFSIRNRSIEAKESNVEIEQPLSDISGRKGLLGLIGTDAVQKTGLTKKVNYNGKTEIYPVYRVRLDYLYYNDYNDRIATWITKYESENGNGSLSELHRDTYNYIIENFIYESNPESINLTKTNIDVVGQREAGVTLPDGRVVDGNRRFTCLRRLEREKGEPEYFETAIMDMDIQEDQKQIKLLELSIQHGEEGKVGYDLIDYAIGTYRDIVQTGLLTVEEYAESTNEPIADVKKRLDTAAIVCEFLEYIGFPGQYHIAREYQVYSLFFEMLAPLKKLDADDRKLFKEIAFNNAIMDALKDQRKFIRDIKSLIAKNNYRYYFDEQQKISEFIRSEMGKTEIRTKADLDKFAETHSNITEEMQNSMERSMQHNRALQLRAKPSENVSKCISLLMDVDTRLFSRLSDEDKAELKQDMEQLSKIVESFKKLL